MSEIMKVRKEMLASLYNPEFARVRHIVADWIARLKRRPSVRRAPPQRVRITSAMKQVVRRMAKENPDMTMAEIAVAVGIRNAGRISEILHPYPERLQ